ncbi:hypothetical protein CRUP_037767 [Coryphaenoides rupestris]|nr:hypothetical protein CRUP_037767 [Coryphaenoides rupestris]
MSAAKGVAVGIDLGTTYSCVGVFQHGKVEIIANDQGNRTTPSYVAFTDTERLIGDAAKNQVAMNPNNTVFDAKRLIGRRLIGDAAKNQVAMNPNNTVFDAKRLIGRRFDDAAVQADMKHWPFTVTSDAGKPKIQVEHKGEAKSFNPEEVSSMVLVGSNRNISGSILLRSSSSARHKAADLLDRALEAGHVLPVTPDEVLSAQSSWYTVWSSASVEFRYSARNRSPMSRKCLANTMLRRV